MRQRAAWLTPIQPTPSPSTRPELGQKSAATAHRAGGAERLPAPAVPQSLAGARALLGPDDQRLRDVARASLTTAKQPQAQNLSRLRPAPGSARACAWGCSATSMLAPASRGAKMASRLAASSRARRRRRGRGRAPRARRAGTPSSRGPSRQRPGCCSGPSLPATSPCPHARKHPGRAQPCPSWASPSAVPSLTWSSATPRAIGPHGSTAQGAERRSRTPPGTTTGAAGVSGSVLPGALRHGTRRSPEACWPRACGLCWDSRSGSGLAARVVSRGRGLPLPRACDSRAHGTRAAPPWPRTGRGDREVSRA